VISGNHTIDGTGNGTFTSALTGLASSTTYFVRAYATNSFGTAYGNQVSFTTTAATGLPTITTVTPAAISQTSAISGGNITADGGSPVTIRGICWSTSAAPVVTGSHTTDGSGTGTYASAMTALLPGTQYYIRAYATNSNGTAYGNEINFTTINDTATVYVGAGNNKFYALNALNGQVKWQYTSTDAFTYAGPCYANGKIYAGGIDSYLYCFDAVTGTVNWKFLAGSAGIECDPVYDNGTIYFGSNDHYFYAIDATTGALKWRYLTGGNVSSSPVVHNGRVFFGSSDSKVYALNTTTGLVEWSYLTGAMINQSGPRLVNGLLYIGSRDGYLYALNENTGTMSWRYSVNNISLEMCSPVVANNIVYVAGWFAVIGGNGARGSVYAINATTGQLLWEKYQNTGFSSCPVIDNGVLYISNESGDVLAMDAATGNQRWSRSILANSAAPAVKDGTVYVGGGGTGYFYALDALTGADKWKFAVSGSLMYSGPCIVKSGLASYSGQSGMLQ
jgi:outer membrane protein assembly factor BamB